MHPQQQLLHVWNAAFVCKLTSTIIIQPNHLEAKLPLNAEQRQRNSHLLSIGV